MGEPLIINPLETLSGLYFGVDGTLRVEHIPHSDLFPRLYELLGCEMLEPLSIYNALSGAVDGTFYVDEDGGPLIKKDAVLNVNATAFANYLGEDGRYVVYGDAFLFIDYDRVRKIERGLTPELVALVLKGLELATGKRQVLSRG